MDWSWLSVVLALPVAVVLRRLTWFARGLLLTREFLRLFRIAGRIRLLGVHGVHLLPFVTCMNTAP